MADPKMVRIPRDRIADGCLAMVEECANEFALNPDALHDFYSSLPAQLDHHIRNHLAAFMDHGPGVQIILQPGQSVRDIPTEVFKNAAYVAMNSAANGGADVNCLMSNAIALLLLARLRRDHEALLQRCDRLECELIAARSELPVKLP